VQSGPALQKTRFIKGLEGSIKNMKAGLSHIDDPHVRLRLAQAEAQLLVLLEEQEKEAKAKKVEKKKKEK
jgi:hypothetical protein